MEQSEKVDARIILETGCNKNNSLETCSDLMIIGRENKMKEIDNEQYQHVGNGTAIMVKRGLRFQHTREAFNNDKMVSMVIHQERNSLLIAGLQANNEHG